MSAAHVQFAFLSVSAGANGLLSESMTFLGKAPVDFGGCLQVPKSGSGYAVLYYSNGSVYARHQDQDQDQGHKANGNGNVKGNEKEALTFQSVGIYTSSGDDDNDNSTKRYNLVKLPTSIDPKKVRKVMVYDDGTASVDYVAAGYAGLGGKTSTWTPKAYCTKVCKATLEVVEVVDLV